MRLMAEDLRHEKGRLVQGGTSLREMVLILVYNGQSARLFLTALSIAYYSTKSTVTHQYHGEVVIFTHGRRRRHRHHRPLHVRHHTSRRPTILCRVNVPGTEHAYWWTTIVVQQGK